MAIHSGTHSPANGLLLKILSVVVATTLSAVACSKKKSSPSVEETTDSGDETYTQSGPSVGSTESLSLLAQTIIADLVRTVGPAGINPGTTNLSEAQAAAIGEAAKTAVSKAGVSTSGDATKLVGIIMQGALESLNTTPVAISDPSQMILVTGKVASSIYTTMKTIEPANLPDASATPGMSAKATAQSAMAKGAINAVPTAVAVSSNIGSTLSGVAQVMVANVGAGGSDEETILQADLPALAAGLTAAVATLPSTAGDKRAALRSVAEGAVKGVAGLTSKLPTFGSVDRAVAVLISAMVENLDVLTKNSATLRLYTADLSDGGAAGLDSVAAGFGLTTYERADLTTATVAASSRGLSIVASKVAASASRADSTSIVSGIQAPTLNPTGFGVTAGTYTKFVVDASGRITSGHALSVADIPDLHTSKLVAGVIPVSNGGTGTSFFSMNGVLVGNGSSNLFTTAAGSAYQVLTVPASGGSPSFGTINLSQSAAVTGVLPLTRGGTGIASTATFPTSGTVVTRDATETLTHKTLTSPVISAGTINGSSLIAGSTAITTSGSISAGAASFSGNVGLGTTAPTQRLQVGSSGDGTVAVANAWNTFSDLRLKRDLTIIPGALDKLLELHGYYYFWKNGTDQTRQLGVVAQEVEALFPELVKTDSTGIKTVDYAKLSAVLIEAVKTQQGELNQVKAEAALLKMALCTKFADLEFCALK